MGNTEDIIKQAALKRLQEAQAELDIINKYEELKRRYSQKESPRDILVLESPAPKKRGVKAGTKDITNAAGEKMFDSVINYLKEVGKPIQSAEIKSAMAEKFPEVEQKKINNRVRDILTSKPPQIERSEADGRGNLYAYKEVEKEKAA